MGMRERLDISAYLVVGPENTQGRRVEEVVRQAVEAGFRCIQLRSKVASAREMLDLARKCAAVIEQLNQSSKVTLVVDDRLDIVLAAREQGIKVDGIHVGQSDIPVEVCRKYLGEEGVIGLSARADELLDYIKTADITDIDYFGVGPLHKTQTKPDCGLGKDGKIITRSLEEIVKLKEMSRLPVVVGGGVKLEDIPELARTGVDGFFVVSAVTHAENVSATAAALVQAWKLNQAKSL